jgi:peptidyl-prolyl cis-trans isomerase D
MLDIMRRKKRLKLILWLVIISLGMGMLLLFVPGQNVGIQGFDNSIATVVDETISVKDFSDAYRHYIENYSAQMKDNFDPETLKRLGLDRQTLNSLIQMRVVDYIAKRFGLSVMPEEISHAIELNPNLRNQNGFIGVQAYKALLAANRIEVEDFEESVRFTLLSKKVSSLLTDSLTIPESQLRENFGRQTQEAQVQYVLLEQEAARKRMAPVEADLRAYFDANKEKYTIKEERKAQYLLLPLTEIAPTVKVSDKEADDAWIKQDQKEMVDASHILFKVESPAKDAEVKAAAEAVLKRAQAGEDFAELARKHSQDEGSAAQGGSLGPFPRGRMTPVFEEAAFALKPGAISGLVRTEFGYHIIKISSHQVPNKELALPNLIRSVQLEKASEIARQKAAEAAKLIETQKDFAVVAKSLGVPAQILETPFFNRSADPNAHQLSMDFIAEVFKLKDVNAVGGPVNVGNGMAILKLLQVTPPKPPDFALAREQVKKDYIEVKADEWLQAEAKRLIEDAKSLKDLAKAAQKAGVAVKTSESFKYGGTVSKEIGASQEFSAAAFALQAEGVGGPVSLGGGKQIAVLQLKSLTPFNEAEYAKQKEELKEQALSSSRQAYFEDYIRKVTDDLTKARKIRINPATLEQITGNRYQ